MKSPSGATSSKSSPAFFCRPFGAYESLGNRFQGLAALATRRRPSGAENLVPGVISDREHVHRICRKPIAEEHCWLTQAARWLRTACGESRQLAAIPLAVRFETFSFNPEPAATGLWAKCFCRRWLQVKRFSRTRVRYNGC